MIPGNVEDIEISVRSASDMLARGKIVLLDVRDPWERKEAEIKGSVFIPLQDLPQRLDRLPKDKLIVTHCHFGQRSLTAARFLRTQGFAAKSMTGGINEWSRVVDKNVPTY
jgi:sulfur-carrier protein adenylyltransferase/sulfurtransferase